MKNDRNLTHHSQTISKEDKNLKFNHGSPVIWLTGLPSSGKSTIANALEESLFDMGIKTHILDGDNIRLGLNKDLGFSKDDRKENVRRIAEVSKLMSDSGTLTIAAFISPFIDDRELIKGIVGEQNFIEVYINTDISICEQRDTKGLYKKARNGEIKDFTGISSPYEVPLNPKLIIDAGKTPVLFCVAKIIIYLQDNGIIPMDLENETNAWSKINHGGNRTENEDKKNAIFIGRFQPYHEGHTSLVKQKLNAGIPALIMVRDIQPDEKNPFTTEQTINMIEKYHRNDDVIVMAIPDIESVNYGRGVGYEVNEFIPPDNIGAVSATKIRESLNIGDNAWRKMVDISIQDDIVNYLGK